jgi:hypothetical protein
MSVEASSPAFISASRFATSSHTNNSKHLLLIILYLLTSLMATVAYTFGDLVSFSTNAGACERCGVAMVSQNHHRACVGNTLIHLEPNQGGTISICIAVDTAGKTVPGIALRFICLCDDKKDKDANKTGSDQGCRGVRQFIFDNSGGCLI